VSECACGVIENLSVSEENKLVIVQNYGFDLFLELMKTHSANAYIQEKTCLILLDLIKNSDSNTELLLQKRIQKQIQYIMKLHPSNEKIVSRVARVIMTLENSGSTT